MKVYRNVRGKPELMIIESDQVIYPRTVEELRESEGVLSVTYLELERSED